MQLKMFTIPIKNVNEAEAEMNAFLRGHRVLAVKKEQRTSNTGLPTLNIEFQNQTKQ